MRPLQIPAATPTDYDEVAIRTQANNYKTYDGNVVRHTTEQAGAVIRVLIDEWLRQGAKWDKVPLAKKSKKIKRVQKAQTTRVDGDIEDEADEDAIIADEFEEPEIMELSGVVGEKRKMNDAAVKIQVEQFADQNSLKQLRLYRPQYKPDYGLARRGLIDKIGQYCSYCESSIFSHLAIEHRLPKKLFPHLAYRWDNFLLACGPCNSTKGASPSLYDVGNTPFGSIDDAMLALDSTDRYAWPDRYATMFPVQPSMLPVSYRLEAIKYTTRKPTISAINDLELDKILDCYRNGEVKVDGADVGYGTGSMDRKLIATHVYPQAGLSVQETAAVQAVIDLVGLNRNTGAASNYSVDRRVISRTLAMLCAMDLHGKRSDAIRDGEVPEAIIHAFDATLREVAAATGFWGVWVTVFGATPGAQEMLADVFPGTAPRNWVI